LDKTPEEKMENGEYMDIPIMIGNTNFEGMFVRDFLLSRGPLGTDVLEFYNDNPEFVVPLSFNLTSNSSHWFCTIDANKSAYFERGEDGDLEEWVELYSDEMIRFPLNRVAKFHANSSTQLIFYFDFKFDGSLGLMKQQLGLKNKGYAGATNGDELLYLFKTSLPGFEAEAHSTIVQKRMTKMWTNFAKLG
jgi:carboxylesterase type B